MKLGGNLQGVFAKLNSTSRICDLTELKGIPRHHTSATEKEHHLVNFSADVSGVAPKRSTSAQRPKIPDNSSVTKFFQKRPTKEKIVFSVFLDVSSILYLP